MKNCFRPKDKPNYLGRLEQIQNAKQSIRTGSFIGRGGIQTKRLIRFWNPLLLITVFIYARTSPLETPFDLASSKIDLALFELFPDAGSDVLMKIT
jgi:hypothetical protein